MLYHTRRRMDEIALKEYYRSRQLIAHPSVRLEGFEQTDRFACNGPVWVSAYSVLVIADDGFNSSAKGSLRCGASIYIGEQCNIRASGGAISIGNEVMISNNVSMAATNHGMSKDLPMNQQPWAESPCGIEIGDNVWIGSHAILLPGCRIGSGSVVAAGAVVLGEIPPMSVCGGVPARLLKPR